MKDKRGKGSEGEGEKTVSEASCGKDSEGEGERTVSEASGDTISDASGGKIQYYVV